MNERNLRTKDGVRLFILLALLFIFPLHSYAQDDHMKFRATEFAKGERVDGKIVWGDWESDRSLVVFDQDNDVIKVHNDWGAVYYITEYEDEYEEDGSTKYNMKAVDEENIECNLQGNRI